MKLKPMALAAIICAGALIVFGLLGTLALYFGSGRDFNFTDEDFTGWLGPGTTYTIDEAQEASLNGITKITISDVSCRIILSTGGQQLSAHLAGECVSTGDPIELAVTPQSSTLRIEVKYPGVGIRNSDCTLTVTIPADYSGDLSINTVSASISTKDMTNELSAVDVNTTSGNCTLSSLTVNNIRFNSVSGDLTVDGTITDGIIADTTSGSVRAAEISGPIRFSSVSGSGDFTCGNPGDIDSNTTSGDLVLRLEADTGFQLDFSSTSGDLQNDFPITLTSGESRHVKGTAGDGSIRIEADSVSGDVTILKK